MTAAVLYEGQRKSSTGEVEGVNTVLYYQTSFLDWPWDKRSDGVVESGSPTQNAEVVRVVPLPEEK